MLELERITFDPAVMSGKACIRGMRITVSLIVNLVANGMSTEEIIGSYPYLEREDIRQALQYAAWLTEETVHPLELAQHEILGRHGHLAEDSGLPSASRA